MKKILKFCTKIKNAETAFFSFEFPTALLGGASADVSLADAPSFSLYHVSRFLSSKKFINFGKKIIPKVLTPIVQSDILYTVKEG